MTQTPDDEAITALTRAMMSRRLFLRGAGTGAAALALAACGTKGTAKKPAQQVATDHSDRDKTLNFSNWPLYIDVDDKTKKKPSLDKFIASSGIAVKYTEDINDNDEFFGKVHNQLSAGQDTGRDLIVLTDWMAARLVRFHWVEKLDHANIPNFKNVQPVLQKVGFDPHRDYTLPWQSGLTGISYNPKSSGGPVKTVTELLTDPRLKGKVTALTEMRDTIGLIMLEQGKDPEKFTDDDFANAADMLQKAVSDKQIRKFTGNDYAQDLAAGNIAAALAWSGDVIQLQADNPKIAFVVPDAGCMLWSDNMMIPNKAQHKKNAEKLMNFYYDPVNAAMVAAYVNYICPVAGAQEELAKTDPGTAKNPLIFPDAATLKKTHGFKALDAKTEKKYNDMFQKVIGV